MNRATVVLWLTLPRSYSESYAAPDGLANILNGWASPAFLYLSRPLVWNLKLLRVRSTLKFYVPFSSSLHPKILVSVDYENFGSIHVDYF